jgi:hypothetical protein
VNAYFIASSVIVDQSHFPEPVHEEIDPSAGRTHHFCQRCLTDLGNRNFGLALFTEVRKQEENTS